jgi:serine/threonine protein kinase
MSYEYFNSKKRELQTMVLSRHINLLPVYGSFVNGSKLFIVTPFLSAGSGLDIMKTSFKNGIEENAIAAILKQVLEGLNYLHSHGLIHRDIKAGNLLVQDDGLVQLADFGVSSSLTDHGSRNTSRKTFVGTPCWMAPGILI